MKRLVFLAVLLWSLASIAQTIQSTKEYVFVPFSKPGATSTELTGINDKGQMTGTAAISWMGTPFIWHDNVFTVIDPQKLSGQDYEPLMTIYAINNHGTYVGELYSYFSYTIAGFMVRNDQFIPVIPEISALAWATSINNHGYVVGTANTPLGDSSSFIGFMRRPDGTFKYIDPCNLTYETDPDCYNFLAIELLGINDKGTIVGQFLRSPDLSGDGLIYRNGKFTYYKHPAVQHALSSVTRFTAINRYGTIVGTYQDTSDQSGPAPRHGFLFRNGVYSPLDYPGASETNPKAINSFGIVVGSVRFGETNIGFVAIPRKHLNKF